MATALSNLSLEQEKNPWEAQAYRFDLAAKKLNLDDGIWKVLRYPTREIIVHIPVQMDDGTIEVFTGYRVQPAPSSWGPARGRPEGPGASPGRPRPDARRPGRIPGPGRPARQRPRRRRQGGRDRRGVPPRPADDSWGLQNLADVQEARAIAEFTLERYREALPLARADGRDLGDDPGRRPEVDPPPLGAGRSALEPRRDLSAAPRPPGRGRLATRHRSPPRPGPRAPGGHRI